MIDAFLLPAQRRATEPLARAALRLGLHPDQVTIGGFLLGLAALPALALHFWPLALALIALNRLADGIDGAMARLTRPTDRGAFLDIALDFLFYALVPLGFALADPARNALPAAALIAAFVGTGSSFLAFAAIAAKRGEETTAHGRKAFFYSTGLAEGAETIAVFIAMCLWPAQFAMIAYGYAALCLLTVVQRSLLARKSFE